MGDLCVAFWNVCNLFEAGVTARGPRDGAEYAAKVAATSRVIASLADGRVPDIVAMAEIGSKRAALDLLAGLADVSRNTNLRLWWEEPALGVRTGLAVVWDPLAVTIDPAECVLLDAGRRPYAAWLPFSLPRGGSLVLVVNHWKSDYGDTTGWSVKRRMGSAATVRERLDATAPDTPVMLVGDFNAEPGSPELDGLGAGRLHSQTREVRGSPRGGHVGRLYNTAWRFMGEPDPWDTARAPDHKATRPRGSWFGSAPLLLDHLVVSAGALRGPGCTLLESRLRYHTDRHADSGHLTRLDASDHLPLVAWFDVPTRRRRDR